MLAAEQIAHGLSLHNGKVTVFVPHYVMSGGTLLALSDMAAASIVKLTQLKPAAAIGDEMLVLADVAQKARVQVVSFVAEVLLKHLPKERAAALATILSEGRWTHDFPITVEAARDLGLPVSTDMPSLIHDLMDLYPQGGGGRPSVIYVPLRRGPEAPVRQDDSSQKP